MQHDVDSETRVTAEYLSELGRAILDRLGMARADVQVTVDSLVEADLRGIHSHGMMRMPTYVERLEEGGNNPSPNIGIIRRSGATVVLDGDNGLGQVVSKRAMELAIATAREEGVGLVGVRNSDHFGGCFYWAEMALPHDMIGVATTNSGPIMAPWGGLTRTFGNNPVGVAVPAGEELPISLDMAMSVVAGGKLDQAMISGKSIPLGWALDPDGRPTDDPSKGRAGLLLPAGGYKGYGAIVVLEVLAAVLTGAHFARQVPPRSPSVPRENGHFFQAINIDAFMPVSDFKGRIDDLIRQLKSSALMPGCEHIWLPGEKEFLIRAKYLKEGIPMPRAVVETLKAMAAAG